MSVLTLILAGGVGSRLSILGAARAKPAIPFAGKYRIIDFALSNAVNSELARIAVLTQHRAHSLIQHLGIGEPWDLNRRRPNGLQIWHSDHGRHDEGWQRGTADALYQNRSLIAADGSDRLLVLSGDHIYKQDYRELLRFHEERGADLTVGVMHVRQEEVERFGIVSVGGDRRITGFSEKPRRSDSTLASMGIYVFNTGFLLRRLRADARDAASSHDFGKDIIPEVVANDKVFAFPFSGYWVDVGTIAAYWQTNLALLEENPALDLYDTAWTIFTRSKERPPVKCRTHAHVEDSLLSNGCVISGTVINSVLSPGVRVERGAVVRDSVIMNDTTVRAGARVECCVLDKEIDVGTEARIGGGNDHTPNEREPANLSTGITIVGNGARIPAGATIGRNCRIDPHVTPDDFERPDVPSGASLIRR